MFCKRNRVRSGIVRVGRGRKFASIAHPELIFDDVVAYAREGGPFAVRYRLDRAPFVHLALADLAGEAVGGNARERLPAHVAVRRPRVRGRVPVVVTREEVLVLVTLNFGSDVAVVFRTDGFQRGHPLVHFPFSVRGEDNPPERRDYLEAVVRVLGSDRAETDIGQFYFVEQQRLQTETERIDFLTAKLF